MKLPCPQFIIGALILGCLLNGRGQTIPQAGWETALASMPLHARELKFKQLQAAPVILKALRKNDTVKGILFLPGATDELYFFDRGHASFRGHPPTLLDGIRALTNKTAVRVHFRPPFLIIAAQADLLEPEIKSAALDTPLKVQPYSDHFIYLDRGWDSLAPVLQKGFSLEIEPKPKSVEAMHFARVYMTGFGLTRWETLEALSLCTKSKITITTNILVFENEGRNMPKIDSPEQKQPL